MSKVLTDQIEKRTGGTAMDVPTSGKWPQGNIADDAVGAAQMANDAVGVAELSATGTASATTYLRGDNAWTAIETGTEWQAVQTAAFTAVAGKGYPVNTTAGVIAVTLPAGSVGDVVEILDYAGTAATNNITVVATGTEKIKGVASETFYITGDRVGVRIVYIDATQGWVAATAANDVSAKALSSSVEVEYLVIAGGGGGGSGTTTAGYGRGGGGAGGYRTNFGGTAITFTPGITYTATVGTGGGGSTNGLDSSLAGSDITNIVSTGGGSGTNDGGNAGGSGGGGATNTAGGAGNTPSTSPAQGFAGGTSTHANAAGGGGGASEVGDSVSGGGDGGNGGDGVSNSITGAAVTYAGGGGAAGNTSAGSGGAGGGGTGYKHSGVVAATAGTDGLGAGGGGGSCSSCGALTGGDGGDGVVILRMLSTAYTGVITGSPAVTTDGLYKVIKFTGTGTYVQ